MIKMIGPKATRCMYACLMALLMVAGTAIPGHAQRKGLQSGYNQQPASSGTGQPAQNMPQMGVGQGRSGGAMQGGQSRIGERLRNRRGGGEGEAGPEGETGLRARETDKKGADKEDKTKKGETKAGAEEGAGGPTVITGGDQAKPGTPPGKGGPAKAGAQPAAAGTETVGTAAPGPRKPGAAPAAPANFKRGEGAVKVTGGGKTAFEPSMEHPVEYREPPLKPGYEKITEVGPLSVQEFMMLIHESTKWSIVMTEAAQKAQLQFFLTEQPPSVALEVLKFNNIQYDYDEKLNLLSVRTKDEWLKEKFGGTELLEFTAQYADVAYTESVLTPLLSASGRIMSDPKTAHFYVWDTADNLGQMVKTLETIDVPMEKRDFEIQFAQIDNVQSAIQSLMSPGGMLMADPRTNRITLWDLPYALDQAEQAVLELDIPLDKAEFLVQNASVGDIESVLKGLSSPDGKLISDVRTGQIIVWDLPSTIEKMEATVARLDVPVESRSFPILHIEAEKLVTSLEPLLSERGSIVVDPRMNAIVVTDLPKRIENMAGIVATLDQQLETRSWIINYADMDFLSEQLESIIPENGGEVVVNDDVHKISVTSLPARLDEVDRLIKTWDVKRRQVFIEAYIAEMSDSVVRDIGINWSYYTTSNGQPMRVVGGSGFTRDSGDLSVGQLPYEIPALGDLALVGGKITRPALTNVAGKPVFHAYGGNNLGAALNYLENKDLATVLSRPSIVVQDGEEALFENATQVPYVSSSFLGGSSYGNSRYGNQYGYGGYGGYGNSNRVEFLDVGTVLSVLPRITDTDTVLLDISAEDSTYTNKEIVYEDKKSTVPEKTLRHAETQLRVRSGETVVLGGLSRDRYDHSLQKAPVLGDIPILGRLLNSPSRSAKNSELLIFLTTTVVDEFSNAETEKLAKTLDKMAKDTRHLKKGPFGRLVDNLTAGKNELNVTIGESGRIYAESKPVTLEELQEACSDARDFPGAMMIIRKHPMAPKDQIDKVVEMALQADLKVEYDSTTPVVTPSNVKPVPGPETVAPGTTVPAKENENPVIKEVGEVPGYAGEPRPAINVPPMPEEKKHKQVFRHEKEKVSRPKPVITKPPNAPSQAKPDEKAKMFGPLEIKMPPLPPVPPGAKPTEKPAAPVAKPDEKPAPPVAKPAEKPASPEAKPVEEPSAPETKPAEEPVPPEAKPAEKPVAPEAKPAEPEPKPAEKPVAPEAKPAEPEAKPAEKPVAPEAKPAEPEPKPAEETVAPAEKPAEPEAKPAEKPAAPEAKPAEEKATPPAPKERAELPMPGGGTLPRPSKGK